MLEIVGKDGQALGLLNEATGEETLTEEGLRRMAKGAKKGTKGGYGGGKSYPPKGSPKPK